MLYKLNDLVLVKVISRPSKICKSKTYSQAKYKCSLGVTSPPSSACQRPKHNYLNCKACEHTNRLLTIYFPSRI